MRVSHHRAENFITDLGAGPLVRALEVNTTLTTLTLQGLFSLLFPLSVSSTELRVGLQNASTPSFFRSSNKVVFPIFFFFSFRESCTHTMIRSRV
jgi:hypothetical protein